MNAPKSYGANEAHTDLILMLVNKERGRQEELRNAGKFAYTCATDPGMLPAEKLSVLAEEFGEVAKHITECVIDPARLDKIALQNELIQVAACAVAWAEALEKEIIEGSGFNPEAAR